jgi:predicted TPR repeat methyltransferase
MTKRRFLDEAYLDRTGEETRKFYDEWSGSYDQEVGENDYRQPLRCATALAQHMTDRGRPILDAGCGTGLSGIALAKAGFTWIDGCDFSPGMFEKAGNTGIYKRLFESDLNSRLDVADSCYAGLAAVGVFSFGHVAAVAVDEFCRIVEPGGVIVVGLNDHFYQEGSLIRRIEELAAGGKCNLLTREPGEHLPGIGLGGWVLVLRRSAKQGAG